jgi:hypothetical protein
MRLIPLLLLFGISACSDTIVNLPNDPAPPPKPDRIEFRVSGNASSIRIRHSNSQDGFTQVTTAPPYFVSINSTAPDTFLSLEATPLSYPFTVTNPFVSIQIFVNGSIFREASSTDFSGNTISISGTWRK